jgi:hypothetical protein
VAVMFGAVREAVHHRLERVALLYSKPVPAARVVMYPYAAARAKLEQLVS